MPYGLTNFHVCDVIALWVTSKSINYVTCHHYGYALLAIHTLCTQYQLLASS